MENKYHNLKVEQKLNKAFSKILIFFLIVLVTSLLALALIGINIRQFHNVSFQNCILQEEIRKDLQIIDKMVLWSMTTHDLDETKKYLEQATQYEQLVDENINKLKETFPDKDHIIELEESVDKVKELRRSLSACARVNDNSGAIEIFNGTYQDAHEEMQSILLEIGEHSNEDADIQYYITNIVSIISFLIVIALAVLAYLFIKKISDLLTKILKQPIIEIETATEELKKGNLQIEINYESEDELGALAGNFKDTCDALNEIVSETDRLLSEMSDGNFNINTLIEDRFVGQFSAILLSMRKMNRHLDETLKQISIASDQVASGSAQLAESAQELAEGATEQAGAIEELTATVENIASISRESAKSADTAYNMIRMSVSNAEKSQENLLELTEAMTRISDTSKEIQNIIDAIEDIADQTNLLSLNASIEAARAGEAGKGFSVVADQIGKLAADSAQSAANTRTLINKALEEIENGNQVTEKTVQALSDVLHGMNSFADVAKNASQSSESQADMLNQIQEGIEQISGVVQNNSATAQETSATSEELSAQSENLKALVGRFRLRE